MKIIESEQNIKALNKRIKRQSKNGKPTVAVLCGGRSFEHDISILTAQTIANAVPDKYNVYILYQSLEGAFYLVPFDLKLARYKNAELLLPVCIMANSPFLYSSKHKKLIKLDVVLNCTHGQNCEDGTLTHLFNLCGIASSNAGATCQAVTLDKEFMKDIFCASGFDTPRYVAIKRDENNVAEKLRINNLEYPVIVKPANLGSSIGICVCESEADLGRALEFARGFDDKVIVEQYLDGVVEVNCSAMSINGKVRASGCEVPNKRSRFLSFSDKYCAGEGKFPQKGKVGDRQDIRNKIFNKTTFLHSQEGQVVQDSAPSAQLELLKDRLNDFLLASIQKLTCALYEKFDCRGVVRIDYLVKDDKIYVNEINTIPGSLAYYLWGEDIEKFVDDLIVDCYREFKKVAGKNYALLTHILGD